MVCNTIGKRVLKIAHDRIRTEDLLRQHHPSY